MVIFNKYTGFHVLLLFALAIAAASTLLNELLCLIGFALLVVASALIANKFEKEEKHKAQLLILLSTVLAVIIVASKILAKEGIFAVLPAILALFIVYAAFKRNAIKSIRAQVVGESKGYLLVEVLPSVIASVAPGTYAVKSEKRFARQSIVEVELSKPFFGSAKPVKVKNCRKKE